MLPNARLIVMPAAVMALLVLVSCAKPVPVPPVNVTPDGIAIKGYDPVAYFSEKKPVKGSSGFSYEWQGARWLFSNAANREAFMSAPENYAPRYGGYCAYAISQGKTADIDPEAWTVYENRLYLNLNKDVQRLWERDMLKYIGLADMNWPRMMRKGIHTSGTLWPYPQPAANASLNATPVSRLYQTS